MIDRRHAPKPTIHRIVDRSLISPHMTLADRPRWKVPALLQQMRRRWQASSNYHRRVDHRTETYFPVPAPRDGPPAVSELPILYGSKLPLRLHEFRETAPDC